MRVFQREILNYYKKHKRKLPWRNTKNPYHILVSEIMLQQTQVERVIPKYKAFLKEFPTLQSLADAHLRDVLMLWQGLGYNRRAKLLHEAAKQVIREHNGRLPVDKKILETLCGIGPYTARALCVFAYNQPSIMIETNIRTVYLHFFFKHKESVSDNDIRIYVEKTLHAGDPREWYSALMDYGSMLKKKMHVNMQSKHYTKQPVFKGSDRQIRGQILRTLLQSKRPSTKKELVQTLQEHTKERVLLQLKSLQAENLIASARGKISIA